MANTVGQINVELGLRMDKFEAGLKDVSRKMDKLGSETKKQTKTNTDLTASFKKLGGVIAAAFSVQQIVKFSQQAYVLAGRMEGVQAGFDRLGGTPELMERLTKATRGTVSQLELMQSAVQAGNFGLQLEALPQLFEFASRRAQETGESVDYLVNSIVTGIGRKSPLILDNLGISAVALKKELGGVSMEAANIGDVSAAVGRIATRELESMGDATVTASDRAAQLSASWENLLTTVGNSEAAESSISILTESLNALTDAFSDVEEYGGLSSIADFFKGGEQAAENQRAINKAVNELETSKLDDYVSLFDDFVSEQETANKVVSFYNDLLYESESLARQAAQAEGLNATELGKKSEALRQLASQLGETDSRLVEYIANNEEAAAAERAAQAAAIQAAQERAKYAEKAHEESLKWQEGIDAVTESINKQADAIARRTNQVSRGAQEALNFFTKGVETDMQNIIEPEDMFPDPIQLTASADQLQRLNELYSDLPNRVKMLQTEFNLSEEAATSLAGQMTATSYEIQAAMQFANGLGSSLQGALLDQFQNGDGNALIDFLKNLVYRLAAAAAAAGALSLLMGSITGGVGTGAMFKNIFGNLSGLGGLVGLDGARASGGPVSGGGTYLVGENGPEIFSPSRSGTIIPNNKIASYSSSAMGSNRMASNGGSQSVMVSGTFRVQGNDLVYVLNETNDRRGRGLNRG